MVKDWVMAQVMARTTVFTEAPKMWTRRTISEETARCGEESSTRIVYVTVISLFPGRSEG